MKKCYRCQLVKELSEFNRSSRRLDGLQSHCRACGSSYYQGNRTKHQANVTARNARIRLESAQKVWAYLLEHPCVDCQNPDPRVLDFDHVRGTKVASISKLVGNAYSWTAIQAEIAKCEVRCANCHRIRTADQLGHYAWLVVAQPDAAVAF